LRSLPATPDQWQNYLVPPPLQPEDDELRYARLCEAWMWQIRAIAADSHMGSIFRAKVESGVGTLARDAENQIVVLSPDRNYSTVVDRSLLGTNDPLEFHRWVSSISVNQLPSKFDVREGSAHANDPDLTTLLKDLHVRQAQESRDMTESNGNFLDTVSNVPNIYLIHMQNRRQQSAEFETERSRYIDEYREAKRLTEQMEKDEKEKKKQAASGLESKFYP
jgi:hypothetical protein